MKQIIKNKLYDTKTAEFCGSYSAPLYRTDAHYYIEKLYRKKNGEFFLYGEGGALSPYSEQIETDTWGSGSKIISMTIEEARRWAEKHLNTEDYLNLFDISEDKETILYLTVSFETKKKIKTICAQEGIDINEKLNEIVNAAIN